MITSAYLAVGFLFSHLLHAQTYASQGGTELATWLSHFSPVFTRSIRFSLVLATLLAAFTFIFGVAISREINRRDLFAGLRLCAGGMLFLIIASQAISSSVLRVLYESGFCFVFSSAALVQQVFLSPAQQNPRSKEQYERLWDLLHLAIPLVLGFSAVFGGVGAISSFYDTPQAFIHRQMYRHLYLTGFFAVGMGLFVMCPIFAQILRMHITLYMSEEAGQESPPAYPPRRANAPSGFTEE